MNKKDRNVLNKMKTHQDIDFLCLLSKSKLDYGFHYPVHGFAYLRCS